MSHDVGFHFLGMGANLEQADMTTRILDARSTRAIPAEDGASFEAVEWMSVLRSLTADQTYRRHVRSRVAGTSVTRFLLQNREFPRSVACCLLRIGATLPQLPPHEAVERELQRTLLMVQNVALEGLTGPSLKQTMDEIQKGAELRVLSQLSYRDEGSHSNFGRLRSASAI